MESSSILSNVLLFEAVSEIIFQASFFSSSTHLAVRGGERSVFIINALKGTGLLPWLLLSKFEFKITVPHTNARTHTHKLPGL